MSGGTHYRRSGSGAPVVLIHGVGADLEMWEPVAERLAPAHDVVRYDMLGHGASAKPLGPYRLDDFVDQLRRLVDALGVERFVLAGFSMGGLVAQELYARFPEKVAALALVCTSAAFVASSDFARQFIAVRIGIILPSLLRTLIR